MILYLSKDLKSNAEHLAEQYGEKSNYIEDVDLKNCPDERITLVGHGDLSGTYGDAKYTPKTLADKLIQKNLSQNVKILDLTGCEIGRIEQEENNKKLGESFSLSFAQHLFNRYPTIQINSFNNLGFQEPIYLLQQASLGADDAKQMRAIPLRSKTQFLKEFEEGKKKINEKLSEDNKKRQINQIGINLSNKYSINLSQVYFDVRKLLDSNDNFQFKKERLEKFFKLDRPKMHAIIKINNRIAKLKSEKINIQCIPRFFYKTKNDKISMLMDLVDNIYKPNSDLGLLLTQALTNKNLATKRTLKLLQELKQYIPEEKKDVEMKVKKS